MSSLKNILLFSALAIAVLLYVAVHIGDIQKLGIFNRKNDPYKYKIVGDKKYIIAEHAATRIVPNTDTFKVTLGGRKFDIPSIYITNITYNEDEVTAIALQHALPDYKPRAQLPKEKHLAKTFRAENYGSTSLVVTPISLDTFHKRERGSHFSAEKSEYEGLEKENWYTNYGDKVNGEKLELKKESYLVRNPNDELETLVICYVEMNFGNRTYCKHYFNYKNVRYILFYDRELYLKTWISRQENAIKFIDALEIKE